MVIFIHPSKACVHQGWNTETSKLAGVFFFLPKLDTRNRMQMGSPGNKKPSSLFMGINKLCLSLVICSLLFKLLGPQSLPGSYQTCLRQHLLLFFSSHLGPTPKVLVVMIRGLLGGRPIVSGSCFMSPDYAMERWPNGGADEPSAPVQEALLPHRASVRHDPDPWCSD